MRSKASNTTIYAKNYRINFRDLGFILLFVLYIQSFITKIIDVSAVYKTSVAITTLCAMFFFINLLKMKRISLFLELMALFFVYLTIIAALRTPNNLLDAIVRNTFCMSFLILLEYFFYRFPQKRVFAILMRLIEFLNYANLLSMILYPNGLYRTVNYGTYEEVVKNTAGYARTSTGRVHWLLGHQTNLMRYALPAICIAFLYSYTVKKQKGLANRSKALILACIVEICIAGSASNFIIFAFFVFAYVAIRFYTKIKWWHILATVASLYIMLLGVAGQLSILEWLSGQLDRTIELTSRAIVWSNTLSAWRQHPFLGCGFVDEGSKQIWNLFGVANPHSGYLWVLFEGGIMGVILFVFVIVCVFKRMRGYWQKKSAIVIYASMIALLLAMITDDYIFRAPFTLIIFFLCYHIPDIADGEKK